MRAHYTPYMVKIYIENDRDAYCLYLTVRYLSDSFFSMTEEIPTTVCMRKTTLQACYAVATTSFACKSILDRLRCCCSGKLVQIASCVIIFFRPIEINYDRLQLSVKEHILEQLGVNTRIYWYKLRRKQNMYAGWHSDRNVKLQPLGICGLLPLYSFHNPSPH